MDDFETFKESREKMDPSSRKMTEHQWKQAYAAYRSARERVGGGTSSASKKGSQRRQSKAAASPRGLHRPSSHSEMGLLRHSVREQSAYADLRLIIDILAWVAVAVVVLIAVVSLFLYISVPTACISLLGGLVQIIGIIVARLLVQVLIDIPDIALYRSLQESQAAPSATTDS